MRVPARPVFVVGSPRSGTSILTWSLGQHPRLLPVEETSWIGKFVLDLPSTFDMGSSRGIFSQLSATEITQDEFFGHFGDAINDMVLGLQRRQAAIRDRRAIESPEESSHLFQILRANDSLKLRWVDGTPEYAFYVHPLLKLFPEAKFIHLLRDVNSVVPSLLNFANVAGSALVGSEHEAYDYWMHAVRAAVEAERAFGSQTVMRLRYSDLIAFPERALRRCLDFLGEPFSAQCLEPVGTRINSSRVAPNAWTRNPATDPELVRLAEELSRELLAEQQPRYAPNEVRQEQLARAFDERAAWVGRLELELNKTMSQRDTLRGMLAEYEALAARP